MIVSSGFIIGGAVGGFIAAALIPAFGWQSVFYAGAIVQLVVGTVMIFAMRVSPVSRLARQADGQGARLVETD
jgi:MFS transporter, AAHS family, 4-hydroxybenzoate transporter